MKNKNIYIFLLMFLVCILSISAISATENTSKEVTNTDNKEYSLETTTNQYNDVSNSNDNVELKKEENVNDNRQGKSGTDKTTAENDDPLSFRDLNTAINGNTNSTIYLSHNYKYNSATDSGFKIGILISRNLTVYGNGVTLDGNNMARIFKVDDKVTVAFHNINFINGRSDYGGAIMEGNAYNCTFTGNNASKYGGAMCIGDSYNCTFTGNKAEGEGGAIIEGNAYNCTFTDNKADDGGAMCGGNAIFCTFNGDTTNGTNIIPAIINVINYTSPYMSGERLKFNLTANGTLYDGFNTTIKIYKDGALVKTVYGLTGEGWIVDLNPGNYTAVLSLTDYPEEKSSNATISVTKIYNFTDLNYIINNNTNSTIYLSNNYTYNNASDNNFINGIPISRNLTIYGNGVTIDGNNMARIFNVVNFKHNVNFYDINFINGRSDYGGAIVYGDAYNCNFTGNHAEDFGGAIYNGNAYNCNFNENNAEDGGAIHSGNATNCTFTHNTAGTGGAIYNGNANNCNFNENNAFQGGAIYAANGNNATNCNFNENNATNGGAISFGGANNCTFIGNNASHGGAMYFSTASNCNFNENNANYGGAIFSGDANNCTFIGNNAKNNGGAIYNGNATNCNFNENNATNGGAIYNGYKMYNGNAINCTFYNNTASEGQAIYNGKAILCRFNRNTNYNTTIIYATINVLNYNSTYQSGEKLKFNLTAEYKLFYGFNTTIEIYKNGSLVKTVYGLTGEGWIVDLNPGNYTAVLSLTDYPEEQTAKANITVLKGDTTIVINPIINPEIGKEIIITYTTNSNGTVTIKVNGQPITDAKFTPTKGGIYNVTVEIAENDYYTAATNQTTFTVEKTNTTILISPIIDYVVGKTIPITYTSNSNGTATIKVNGEVIPDGNFTPTKAGTYNLTIEIAENDYYTAATNQTTFTVGKLASQIITSPVTTTYNVGKNLVITLKDENGKPIANATVTVNLGSSKKYTTDAKGQIKINVATLTPKTYNAKITYAGSDNYKSSTKTVKVTVKKATPKITAKSASYKLKIKTKKYTVNLKDNINKPLKNTKVTLKVNGKTYSVKTNSKGQGVFKITNLKKKGSYTAIITVPANTYYNKVTKNVKITVKQ